MVAENFIRCLSANSKTQQRCHRMAKGKILPPQCCTNFNVASIGGALRKLRETTMSIPVYQCRISLSLSLQAILTNTHPLSNVICLNHSVCAMPLYPSNSLDVLFWWPTLLKHMVVSKAQLVYCPILGKFQVLRRTFRKQNVNSIRVFFWAKFGVGR